MIRQFRILYRQFLFRLTELESLSTSARGDSSALLGQFGALLIFGSVLLSFGAISVGNSIRRGGLAAPVWSVERFLISLTMLAVGVFALASWDSALPDRRDVLTLAPLPVRGQALFAAKIAACASAMTLVVTALNCLAAIAWPLILAPSGSGVVTSMRFVAAWWATLLAAGAFIYCAVLGLQAVAAQLPRRGYLRVSPALQIAAFVLFLGVFCFQPSLSGAAALAAPENQRALAWLPTYWFMGLLSEISGLFRAEGHAVMGPLARRAVVGLPVAISIAGGAFLLSYVRTLRKIMEEPDAAPGARGGMWLPPFGGGPQTAIAHFVIRAQFRSPRHRTILSFYLGGGFALAALYVAIMTDVMRISGADLLHRVNVPMLAASVVMLCAAWMGARTVFSLPLELRANWLFQCAPAPGAVACLSATRRALLTLSALPVIAVSGVLLLCFWPWRAVAQHVLVLGLLASILTDLSLAGFRKIPFTCSYLPGKSKVHMLFWFGVIPLVFVIHRFVDIEQRAMAAPLSYSAMAATLAVAAAVARRFANKGAQRGSADPLFEDSASDELVELGLNV